MLSEGSKPKARLLTFVDIIEEVGIRGDGAEILDAKGLALLLLDEVGDGLVNLEDDRRNLHTLVGRRNRAFNENMDTQPSRTQQQHKASSGPRLSAEKQK